MASLKKSVNDLEEEKKSLLTVIKILQTDADQILQTSKDGGWVKAKGNMSQKHRTLPKNTRNIETEIKNRYEILDQ